MWPLAAARLAALPIGLLLLRPMGGIAAPAAATSSGARRGRRGAGHLRANGLYLLAAYQGHLSILAPIASLYPASTVLLALAIDKERLRPVQFVGLGLAGAALVLAAS